MPPLEVLSDEGLMRKVRSGFAGVGEEEFETAKQRILAFLNARKKLPTGGGQG